ncbi:ABC transporter substrate-binding protein [Paenibacillus sp. CAA11]|uniref:extracellular solute-binding protein n=1 Tax=Paenibacillus sp. CAA11 TaxID=1532905 RepID=UPI000D38B8A6|nr:extracellular solute-binding protein [Paenibacillus sp. CAA11]AWB44679.1 ABC transporter substrate-binding protein [Paenibacillus sp. CAA11]
MIFKKKSLAIIILILVTLSSVSIFSPSGSNETRRVHAQTDFQNTEQTFDPNGYESYLKSHSNAKQPAQTIRIEGEKFSTTEGEGFEIVKQEKGEAVLTPESGAISWKVQIDQPGLYNIRIRYLPVEGKSSAIERQLQINQQLPFKEADIFTLDRVWGNRDQKIIQDDRGNDLRPKQVEKPIWQIGPLTDKNGYFDEPLLFYFDEGLQSITLTAIREPVTIDYIELYQEEKLQTYEELKAEYEVRGIKPAADQYMLIQAEEAVYKSSPTLYPISDRSSPTVVPYDVSKIRINTIGGGNWKLPGQWIEWEFEAKEDGLYQIALKEKQNQLRGIFATRSLTIDGKIPFKEMKRVRFDFSRDWNMHVLGEGEKEPYLFHLTKGKHQIRMMVSLGEMAPLLRTIQSSVLQLNETYRKILMITSNTPDLYRDYQLEKRIPGMVEQFKRQAKSIQSVADYLELATGEQSDKVAILHTMVKQLEDMANNPETVAKRLEAFKTNVGGLGTWILTVREQPLALDYIVIFSPNQKLPKADATLMQVLKHEAGALTASYTQDYDSVGNIGKNKRAITAWITTGRDQAQVIKSLIDESFTPSTNISVELKLVPANILLPATLAGEGPDVAMQIGEDVPVNYAMRGAAADLTKFPDFDTVAARFRDSGLVPYKYAEGVYALPEQQTFPMLFYRKDILKELNLKPPETWQDIYNMISVLQKHNMEFYLPIEAINASLVPNATFSMLLYQNGGEFYRDGGRKSALDSDISIEAFKRWTQFYTSYKFPLLADFPNRFRTGEMPIGIADYTTYNMLTVLAPEIKGLWEFTMVPGTKRNGIIHHEVASHTTGVMLLERAKEKEAAWEFMKWWTDKETQIAYGREMEGLMGEAARYPTANVEALEELPWPVRDYRNLDNQWKWVRGIPQVPGGYFTGRHLDNAFRKVVNANENPREALSDYLLYINDEIEVKRKEFKLP